MSVLITLKVKGDTEIFRKILVERNDEIAAVAARSQSAGAIHHRFGVGDGFVLVVDEWGTPEQFEAFFGEESLQALMGDMGADMSVPPEITVTEAISSPESELIRRADQF